MDIVLGAVDTEREYLTCTETEPRRTWGSLMDTLDGNGIAGLLYDVFGTEMTSVLVICGTCGATAVVAEAVVYLHPPGAVVRCRSCTGLLMVITQVRGVHCVDLMGIAALNAPAIR